MPVGIARRWRTSSRTRRGSPAARRSPGRASSSCSTATRGRRSATTSRCCPTRPGDLILYGTEQMVAVSHRERAAAGEAAAAPVAGAGASAGTEAALPDGPLYVTARRGLGPVLAGYLHRAARGAAPAAALRAAAALCEGATASAFAAAGIVLAVPRRAAARAHARPADADPGRSTSSCPVTDNVAVAAGYRHPIHLGSCRGSFPADRLHLFSPGRRHRGVAAAGAGGDRGRRAGARARGAYARRSRRGPRPDLALALRAGAGGRVDGADGGGAGPVEPGAVAAAPLLRAAGVGAAPATGSRCSSAACWCARPSVLEGIPFGTLFELAAPDVLVPVGTRLTPAVSPALLVERLGATEGARSCFPIATSAPFRVPAAMRWFRSSCACVGRADAGDRRSGRRRPARRADRRAGRDREPPDGADAAVGPAPVDAGGLTSGRMRRFVSDFLLPIVRGGPVHVGRPLGLEAVARMLRDPCPIVGRRRRWTTLAACRVASARAGRARGRRRRRSTRRALRLGAALHDLLALGHPELGRRAIAARRSRRRGGAGAGVDRAADDRARGA